LAVRDLGGEHLQHLCPQSRDFAPLGSHVRVEFAEARLDPPPLRRVNTKFAVEGTPD
jgi:hypothetical protein